MLIELQLIISLRDYKILNDSLEIFIVSMLLDLEVVTPAHSSILCNG